MARSGSMAMCMCMVVAMIAMIIMATAPHGAQGAISCQTVYTSLYPCLNYLTSGGPVPVPCCTGIRSLYNAATTTVDRQTACKCMEQASGMVTGINLNYASSLPANCGVKIPYKISPSTDCSRVQ